MSLFRQVAGLKLKKHYFNLSYDNKFSCDIGQLIPVLCEEVIPGDHFKVGNEVVIRLQPLLAPMLQTLDARIELFFVPDRLIDENWEGFITGGKDGKNDYSLPLHDEYYVDNVTPPKYSLWDYFGLPLVKSNSTSDPDKDSLPIDYPWRCYNLVYNEYYRDENVIDAVDLSQGSVLNRCWSKDYFTSSLPFQQRGDEPAFSWNFDDIFDDVKVEFPADVPVTFAPIFSLSDDRLKSVTSLGTSFPYSKTGFPLEPRYSNSGFSTMQSVLTDAYSLGSQGFDQDTSFSAWYKSLGDSRFRLAGKNPGDGVSSDIWTYQLAVPVEGHKALAIDTTLSAPYNEIGFYGLNDNQVVAPEGKDLHVSFSVSELRENFQLQKYLERSARSGYRYVEMLYARFGVRNGDLRLQRPYFLGSARQSIMVSEIPQTSASASGTTKQGNLAGKGLGAMVSKSLCNYFVKEHGYILGLFSIVPKTSYASQGINRKWLKRTKFDYYTPEFAHLSETQILNRELYYTGDASSDLQMFGYQGIYDEYRHNRGIVTSDFRDTFAYWHMARQFSNTPSLNKDFLEIDPDSTYLKAPFAVQNEKNFLVDYANIIHAMRPIPSIAEPGLVDHF